ncbi:MAG: N-6 DNA methylase [Burkholderiaceae bacterium]
MLRELLRTLAPLQVEGDAYGLIFEYFMGQFAASSMQRRRYFTPASIVKLIVEVIEPYHGASSIPPAARGGMFVHSADFVRRHRKAPEREIGVHGVEKMADTLRLARLNLAVHGCRAKSARPTPTTRRPAQTGWPLRLRDGQPRPFNQSEVDRARLVNEAGRWTRAFRSACRR